jgi:NADH-quinone oxidoreductase subunit H
VGILLAGWSSGSKYTMLGAMRSGAQLISYEISAGLSLMVIVILAGTMQLSEIVEQQAEMWFIFKGHIPAMLAFLTYIIAGHAETNRGPFDLPEAESELTAGYHTEYSGIQFGFFYLAEYLNLFIIAAIAATVFLGGWMPFHVPGWESFNAIMDFIPSWIWFFGKTAFCVFLSLWVRWSFPRLRIDQLLNLEWKILMPITIINILLMAVLVIF